MAVNVLLFISWEKNDFQSDYNDIVPLHHYYCGRPYSYVIIMII